MKELEWGIAREAHVYDLELGANDFVQVNHSITFDNAYRLEVRVDNLMRDDNFLAGITREYGGEPRFGREKPECLLVIGGMDTGIKEILVNTEHLGNNGL